MRLKTLQPFADVSVNRWYVPARKDAASPTYLSREAKNGEKKKRLVQPGKEKKKIVRRCARKKKILKLAFFPNNKPRTYSLLYPHQTNAFHAFIPSLPFIFRRVFFPRTFFSVVPTTSSKQSIEQHSHISSLCDSRQPPLTKRNELRRRLL